MSVVERLEDAYLMLQNGRHEGALNSVLTAISGASRERYPRGTPSRQRPGDRMGDHEAFVTFFEDQIKLLRAPNMRVRRPDGQELPLSSILYTLFRCALTHEAGLTSGGTLVPDSKYGRVQLKLTSLDPLGFEITHSTIVFLADLVSRAPEHHVATADILARIMSRLPIHPSEL